MQTLHVIAPFHSRVVAKNSPCAFAGNVLRFSKMMHTIVGKVLANTQTDQNSYRIIEYHAGSTSESEADEHVSCSTDEEWSTHYASAEGMGVSPNVYEPGHMIFSNKCLHEMNKRIRRGDIVCHFYGDAESRLFRDLAIKVRHVECAIGYDRHPWGAERIFPSQAWRHYAFGKYPHTVDNMLTSTVIPHYYDEDEWTFQPEASGLGNQGGMQPGYILYCARLNKSKYGVLPDLVRDRPDLFFKIAGTGDTSPFEDLPNVELLGSVRGTDRDVLFGGARCLLSPTEFVEPFGAVAIEAAFCGTPIIAPCYGAYVETIGYTCLGVLAEGPQEWSRCIDEAMKLPRKHQSEKARATFGLPVIAKQFDAYFRRK